jgi:hypothetical protein
MYMSWLERRKSTCRWQDFIVWLSLDITRWFPQPDQPRRQWACLPLERVRPMAASADRWLLTVLKERQERGLGWNEAIHAPLLVADLAVRPFGERDVSMQPGWLLRQIEYEMSRLVRLTEAPENQLPTGPGMPLEVRYRALGVTLLRVWYLHRLLAQLYEPEDAAERLRSVAAWARLRATAAPAA